MSEGSVTTTGMREMRQAVEQLPQAVTLALRAVAFRVSRDVYADAKRLLIVQQKTDARNLANEMHIEEHASEKAFEVIADAPSDQPANLPTWLEFGTWKMAARPFMRPALDAANAGYKREMEQASIDAAVEVLR
jgi:HK97 gp10 family phage protein